MMMPQGTYTKPIRIDGRAAVLRVAAKAGTIASRRGKARVVPIPLRNVRRGRDFFITNINPGFSSFGTAYFLRSRLLVPIHDNRLSPLQRQWP